MKKIVIGAGGAIIQEKKVLLTRRVPNKDQFPNSWTLPAGRYDEKDELLKHTAVREIKEEVNLDFIPEGPLNFYECQNGEILNISHIFLGNWSGKIIMQRSEVSEFGWFSYQEIMGLKLAFAYNEAVDDLFKLKIIK